MKKVVFFKDLAVLPTAMKQFSLDGFSGKKIPVKLHMGERGNKFFIKPEVVSTLVDVLTQYDIESFLLDSTVAYQAKRHSIQGYLEVAKEHGFTKENIGCPVVIDDTGKPVQVKDASYEVIDHLLDASHIIAVSHVKGHIASGMGGAIKNFGMGGVTKETKKLIHHGSRPEFREELCIHCGVCMQVCPFGAIQVQKDADWKYHLNKCFGCGVCVENCPKEALVYDVKHFQEGLAEAAYACLTGKKGLFLNVVKDIAKSCDCDPDAGPIICPDIGFLLSDDPVAVDMASLDLIYQVKPEVFQKVNRIDPLQQITFAEHLGLGSTAYQLISI